MDLLPFLVLSLGAAQLLRWWGTRHVRAHAEEQVPRTGFRPDLELPGAEAPGDEVVLLVHGTFCDGGTVRAWQRALAEAGRPAWVFEYRYLDSIVRNARILEQDLQARLEALGPRAPRKLLVVGYSQGGLLLRWLLAGGGAAPWLDRVEALVQVASPNGGCEPCDLERLFLRRGHESSMPALEQFRCGSRFLEELAGRPLRPGLGYGAVYGRGPGRWVLGRFFTGDPRGNALSRALGWLFETLFLSPRENDGLVTTESALLLYAEAGLADAAAPRLVETDHLGLLEDPRASRALVELAGELMGPAAQQRA